MINLSPGSRKVPRTGTAPARLPACEVPRQLQCHTRRPTLHTPRTVKRRHGSSYDGLARGAVSTRTTDPSQALHIKGEETGMAQGTLKWFNSEKGFEVHAKSGHSRPWIRSDIRERSVWAALPNNRFHHLTTRDETGSPASKPAPPGCTSWSPAASAGTLPSPPATSHNPWLPNLRSRHCNPGGASPNVPRGTHLAHEHEQPRPPPPRTRFTLSGRTRLSARQSTRRPTEHPALTSPRYVAHTARRVGEGGSDD
jgi:hypothetical protein